MQFVPALLPRLIQAIDNVIEANAEEVTALDQAIGDGDHVTNLQRGIKALTAQSDELAAQLDWAATWQKIGMTMMTAVGGASGSLYGTLFVAMSKAARERPVVSGVERALDLQTFAEIFSSGVDAVKLRGKADAGEKTMLDVLIPVAASLRQAATDSVALSDVLKNVVQAAITGMESTRDMVATKGRASFLEERSRGHIDAGAKTSQLMICALVGVLTENLTTPS
ncbi:dihydroxyacetone kinase subunit DhaL [Methylobacter sp. Wu8]|uniref:Dihydroxyacetone kinase DhaL subunit n=1 Tax=Methylobacter tundripaludum TaxID=173365 RepID=A0A2S6H5N3_9GAMM|nr:dihydroxyacetone kinase subunit DhaL [Methylobacter tundripaludum]MCK9635104.1 dihydroxyacetone kinase subunit DhaL [Methylobacter tundripaludum]MDD2662063.1 dihydroxyacetone kinase subunit DhaL [Methylococcales bacterium]PPK72774.1 dihydroxyacetone kinase DhaL subunit [Methylobacter tundripaludum]